MARALLLSWARALPGSCRRKNNLVAPPRSCPGQGLALVVPSPVPLLERDEPGQSPCRSRLLNAGFVAATKRLASFFIQ